MKKQRILSLLLCLTLLSAAMLTGGSVAAAEEEQKNSGLVLNKTATANTDGTYTITLEAYATGEKTISTVTKDVPTDIVLVLDLSSSMTQTIGTVNYSAYSNKNNEALYALRHNGGEGNLWYKNGDSYYSVSVTAEERTPNYTDASNYQNRELYNKRENLYAKIGDDYVKVEVSQSGKNYTYTYTYTYTYNGETKTATSSGSNTKPTFSDEVTLYVLSGVDTTKARYTYSYTDSTGKTQTIATSSGGTAVPTGATFYSRSIDTSGGVSRLQALKTACINFAEAVAQKAKGTDGAAGTADDVKHRIAIVGFNSSSKLYTGTDNSNALIDMSTSNGESTVKTAISKLETAQKTVPGTGLSTANGIFAANSISAGETRNRVVIFFTDGYPSTSGSDKFDKSLAEDAIKKAETAKDTYGASVYSIAVIAGADPTQAGTEPIVDLLDPGTSDACNWYLQNVSSNNGTPNNPSYYLSASDAASLNSIFQQISDQIENGGSSSKLTSDAVVKDIISPYFTLSAGTAASNITLKTYKYNGPNYTAANAWTENTSGAMGAKATFDTGSNVVSVTGFDFSANWCGAESQTGTTGNVVYRGNKLVISFNVTPKAGFLGGNNVPTNGDDSGVYENSTAEKAVDTFTVPTVNVPIPTVTVTPTEKNVYLTGSLDESALKDGATVTCGDQTLDLSKAADTDTPYGLEKWKTDYVTIGELEITSDSSIYSAGTSLTVDSNYKLSLTVSSKNEPEEGETGVSSKTGTGAASINVFKPELTFKDSTVDYKSDISNTGYKSDKADKTYENDNFVSDETKWTHGEGDVKKASDDSDVTMIGEAPNLTRTYTLSDGVTDGSVTSTTYVPVQANVKIDETDVTSYTTFVHSCDAVEQGKCEWITPTSKGNPAFILHVVNVVGDLTITKHGLNQFTYKDGKDWESAIFTVTGDNKTWTVAINGNSSVTLTGLKVGSYTVTEVTGWTWRYGSSTLNSDNKNENGTFNVNGGQTTTVTCTNSAHKDKWLGGDNYANNVFGLSAAVTD